MLGDDEEERFDRFLFWRLFQPDMLLSEAGRTPAGTADREAGRRPNAAGGEFYDEYRAYREVLIGQITLQRRRRHDAGGAVRLAQKLLDRLIFVMFAEDMGGRVGFPPRRAQEELKRQSRDQFLSPTATRSGAG